MPTHSHHALRCRQKWSHTKCFTPSMLCVTTLKLDTKIAAFQASQSNTNLHCLCLPHEFVLCCVLFLFFCLGTNNTPVIMYVSSSKWSSCLSFRGKITLTSLQIVQIFRLLLKISVERITKSHTQFFATLRHCGAF